MAQGPLLMDEAPQNAISAPGSARRRRRWQFSLGTLLIVTVLCAVLLSAANTAAMFWPEVEPVLTVSALVALVLLVPIGLTIALVIFIIWLGGILMDLIDWIAKRRRPSHRRNEGV